MGYFAIIACLGYFMASFNRTMNIIKIQNDSRFNNQLSEMEYCAVVYEADDFLMISPCYEENGDLHIFKNYQIKIDRNNQLLIKQVYKNIIMENMALLTSESK